MAYSHDLVVSVTNHIGAVEYCHITPWETLLTCGFDGNMCILDRKDLSIICGPIHITSGHLRTVSSTPGGYWIITGDSTGRVMLLPYDPDADPPITMSSAVVLGNFQHDVQSIDVSDDGQFIAAVGDEALHIYHWVQENRTFEMFQVTDVGQTPHCCCFLLRCPFVLVCGTSVATYDIQSGKCVRFLDNSHNRLIRSCAASNDKWATGSWDQTARIWNSFGEVLHVLKHQYGRVSSVRFNSTGHLLVTVCHGSMLVFDVASGDTVLHRRMCHGNSELVGAMFWLDDSKMVSWAEDGSVSLWTNPFFVRPLAELVEDVIDFDHSQSDSDDVDLVDRNHRLSDE